MSRKLSKMPLYGKQIVRYSCGTIIFFLALSGFGQMPIFKRYYIADIPGLGWLAEFWTTHYIHYVGAVLFMGLTVYVVADYLLSRPKCYQLTGLGYVQATVLGGILATGIFLVVRNSTGYMFSPGVIVFLDLSHLGLVMLFLAAAFFGFLFKKRWTTRLQPHMGKG